MATCSTAGSRRCSTTMPRAARLRLAACLLADVAWRRIPISAPSAASTWRCTAIGSAIDAPGPGDAGAGAVLQFRRRRRFRRYRRRRAVHARASWSAPRTGGWRCGSASGSAAASPPASSAAAARVADEHAAPRAAQRRRGGSRRGGRAPAASSSATALGLQPGDQRSSSRRRSGSTRLLASRWMFSRSARIIHRHDLAGLDPAHVRAPAPPLRLGAKLGAGRAGRPGPVPVASQAPIAWCIGGTSSSADRARGAGGAGEQQQGAIAASASCIVSASVRVITSLPSRMAKASRPSTRSSASRPNSSKRQPSRIASPSRRPAASSSSSSDARDQPRRDIAFARPDLEQQLEQVGDQRAFLAEPGLALLARRQLVGRQRLGIVRAPPSSARRYRCRVQAGGEAAHLAERLLAGAADARRRRPASRPS